MSNTELIGLCLKTFCRSLYSGVFRTLSIHKGAKNTQHGTDCGAVSSHGPLGSCLHFYMCSSGPSTSSRSCARALLHQIRPCRWLWSAQDGKKHVAGPGLQDNLITWAYMLISALLKVPLGALREQQQAARDHFGTTEHAQRRGGVAAALTWRKPTKVRAHKPHLGSGRARPRAC